MLESLSRQTRSAFRTTASQNLAAIAGSHALHEAVLLLALTLFGLIGTKHVSSSFRDPPEHREKSGDNHLNLAKTYYILTHA